MHKTNLTLFSQVINHLDRNVFHKVVREQESDKHSKGMSSWMHCVSMLFCQFAKAHSLREICHGLRSTTGNLAHIGINKYPARSTLSYANTHRRWQVFKTYYLRLKDSLQGQLGDRKEKFNIKSKIYLLDSTTISVCQKIFNWAAFRKKKGAIKLHMLLDYDGCLPEYLYIDKARKHDVVVAQRKPLPANSVVVMDRGYFDFRLMHAWHQHKVRFVIRGKRGGDFKVVKSRCVQDYEHIVSDEEIRMTGPVTSKKYPDKLRRVVIRDEDNDQLIQVYTNQLTWKASTIARLYKQRWNIEIFFKEIKQHLHIKSFVGESKNALLIQVWTAMISILILKYLRAKARYGWHLSNLVAFIRMNLFAKNNLYKWLNDPFYPIKARGSPTRQLKLLKGG